MNDVGILGLGVMGRSLAINMANYGFKVSGYNRTDGRINSLLKEGNASGNITGTYSLEEFVNSLKIPRVIFLMTKSGSPVDEMIEKLIPLLEINDIIIDGGNSYYKDTIRRNEYLESKNLRYLGVGVSGGEDGALYGPSIMVGGSQDTYSDVENILTSISAKSKYGDCSALVGNHGAGHYVKMVHNGIEYAMMQAIAEVYQLLKEAKKLSNEEIANVFSEWNDDILNSYLMEITIDILRKKDDDQKTSLVDMILDQAEQKGTGAWTMQSSIELGIPIPSLNAAVVSRNLSHFKTLRQAINKHVNQTTEEYIEVNLEDVRDSLIFTNILIFSQGLWLIDTASKDLNFNINLIEVLKVWSNGCIIRAELLDNYISILERNNTNVTLLDDESVMNELLGYLPKSIAVVNTFNDAMISSPTISSSLDYFYAISSATLPMNLIQAQRDYFGAHTYKRIDKEGIFHSKWNED